MSQREITYNARTGRHITPWGWVKVDLEAGTVEVRGPAVSDWYNGPKAVRTAELFVAHASAEMSLVLAIHGQYAAWSGARGLLSALRA